MNHFLAIERFIQQEKQNSHHFVEWLEQQPEYADLVEQARAGSELRLRKSLFEKCVHALKHRVWLDASTLYGRSHVDKKLISDARATAIILSTAQSHQYHYHNSLLGA